MKMDSLILRLFGILFLTGEDLLLPGRGLGRHGDRGSGARNPDRGEEKASDEESREENALSEKTAQHGRIHPFEGMP